MFSKKFFVLFFFVLFLYAITILLVLASKTQWIDLPIIYFVQSLESPILTDLMLFFSDIGSFRLVIPITVVAMFILFFVLKFRVELIFFLLTMIGSAFINHWLKTLIQRERPSFHRLVEAGGFSFPSGHSMGAFTLYVTLTFLIWKHLKSNRAKIIVTSITVFIILAIGLSRI